MLILQENYSCFDVELLYVVNCYLSCYVYITCFYVELSCNSCYNKLLLVGLLVLSLFFQYKRFSVIWGRMFLGGGIM